MCGINGILRRDGAPVDLAELAELRDTMAHRGPDGAGIWSRPEHGDIAFGHRRLAIVDLSEAGHQPMANEDGTVVVTFNGEIYNHRELRAELERRGHRFRSQCDTEVLVHLYEEHGPAMVERLVGMFAFAIWSEAEQELVLARDRLGIKPLYWIDDGSRFAFASEIKALLPLLANRDIDPVALEQYLTFVTTAPPRTLFAGVSKLPPATVVRIGRSGSAREARYWDPLEDRVTHTADDWEAEIMARLDRSVARRRMSDVPVGVFLSGGVDSSTNVALFTEQAPQPVRTFSIAFEGTDENDELPWARTVAEQFGTDHHELRISAEDLWEFLPTLVHHQDEPIADPVCVPLHFVSKLAKDNDVTVVHVGEGADEIFAGYPTYLTAQAMAQRPWQALRRVPAPLLHLVGRAGLRAGRACPRYEIHGEALARAEARGELWWGGAVAFYDDARSRVTSDAFRSASDPGAPGRLVQEIAADGVARGARDELESMIYQDLRLRLPELLLMRVDKLTMANSVEARVPFLDHELVELAMAIPSELKTAGGVPKAVLKNAVRGVIPDAVIDRPKQGFGAPVASWFRGELGERLLHRLDASSIHDLGWLDRERMRELVAQHRAGRADRSFQLWNLLNLSAWFDHWIAGSGAEGF